MSRAESTNFINNCMSLENENFSIYYDDNKNLGRIRKISPDKLNMSCNNNGGGAQWHIIMQVRVNNY